MKDMYYAAGVGHDFDPSVITSRCRREVACRQEARGVDPSRPEVGLPIGAACAVFPAIGLVVGMAARAGIGAAAGHVKGGISDSDPKELANILEAGQAGLIVVYTPRT